MARTGMTISDAAHSWVREMNVYPQDMIDTLIKAKREDTIVKISDCLSEQVPEIDDWAAYVDLKSDGQAYLYQTYDLETEEVYKDGAGSEYLGEYYSVHVSEMWEDHSVSWSTFYVSVNFDKVLWKDMVGLADSEFEVYTLEEWRNSSYYPSLDD